MRFLVLFCLVPGLFPIINTANAQQTPPVPDRVIQAIGMEPDTTRPAAPTRPDTTQFNSADQLDTVRRSSVLDIEEKQAYWNLEGLGELSEQPIYEMFNIDQFINYH